VRLYRIAEGHIAEEGLGRISAVLGEEDSILWLDLSAGDAQMQDVLTEAFGVRSSALRECEQPGLVPRVRLYTGQHVFVELHAPATGADGTVDALALVLFVGRRYVVTVHENRPSVSDEDVTRDTATVHRRLAKQSVTVESPAELAYAIASAIAQRMESEVGALSNRVVALERSILVSRRRDEELVESMFGARHELVTIQTMASHDGAIFQRVPRVAGELLDEDGLRLVDDLVDQFARVQGMCNTERDFLQELLDLYQTRTNDSMNLAMERLALITAVALPITAVASVYGMNNIVNQETEPIQLVLSLIAMGALTVFMLVWARRQGWW
jgi:Mg2+ and Co2+ transporter CorA